MNVPPNPTHQIARGGAPDELVAALGDGTSVLFRPILPEDRERLRTAFALLSPESRYRRFFRAIDRLSDDELDYLTNVDQMDHVAWVALLRDEPGQPGIGVARWVRDPRIPDTAEAAVTVIDAFHNRGIGTTLLQLAAASAIARGVRRFRAWTIGGNQPVLDILERLGATAGRWESGVLEVTVELPVRPDDLAQTTAPLILRAVATGELTSEMNAEPPGGVHLSSPRREDDGAPDRT
ncbi:MAG TPA: GNAT family N-acetyltransferase [Actinomycetota bacterium]|nr:GNAT family N-acetyltransferase [Actinomycetota bacterium]